MAKALPAYEVFRTELTRRESEIAALLPSTVSRKAFVDMAIIAVKQNPSLLQCDRRSLHKAVTDAARDGLMPDGKEGVIIPHTGKLARWQPMTYGMRKRAWELDKIIIDAQFVCENDTFEWEQGDAPKIIHKPAQLGTERGEMIGAYAVFRQGADILHREVMDAEQIDAVRAISKQPKGLLWTTFVGEAWRKSVVRRGIKTVPCSDALRRIAERDDDAYDVGRPSPDETAPQRIAITPPIEGEQKALPPLVGQSPDERAAEKPNAFLVAYRQALAKATTVVALEKAHKKQAAKITELEDEDLIEKARDIYRKALARIKGEPSEEADKGEADQPTLDLDKHPDDAA